MAQLRQEVRPVVFNMPVEGFGMQTGGSARRRVVPFDTALSSYKVTGIPGHTHNSSAVCSVLVDNTERSNVPLIIENHFAHARVDLAAPRYTDSAAVDESDYDRAIERGIGEIAIVPENCHQEIREPARAISELRTLLMAKDKRDTMTYVEEVGGFVSQTTGNLPDPEPTYPDVDVDLFHTYELPAAAAVAPNVAGDIPGTGNNSTAGAELRFDAGHGAANSYSRLPLDDLQFPAEGFGSSFVPLKLNAATPLATVAGLPWNGVVTLQWDPNAKLYFCAPFEAIFTSMHESYWDDTRTYQSATHPNFEVQFPRIETTVSKDGQCLFTTGQRPLIDATGTDPQGLECTVNQNTLATAIYQGILRLWVWPFRIATGYSSAIRGPDRGTNFWDRVRNTSVEATAVHIRTEDNADVLASFYVNDGQAPPVKIANDDRQLQSSVSDHYASYTSAYLAAEVMPRIYYRNELPGTSYSMLPTSMSVVPTVFGPTYGIDRQGNESDPDVTDYVGISFLDNEVQQLYDADGHNAGNVGDDEWEEDGFYFYNNARTHRHIDVPLLLSRLEGGESTAGEFAQNLLLEGQTHANQNGDHCPVFIEILTINAATGRPHENPIVSETVLYQSTQHWSAVGANLVRSIQYKATVVAAAQAKVNAHNANHELANPRHANVAPQYPTNNIGGNDPLVHAPSVVYGVPQGEPNAIADIVPVIKNHLDESLKALSEDQKAFAKKEDELSLHRSGAKFVYGVANTDDKRSLFKLDSTRLQVLFQSDDTLNQSMATGRLSANNTFTVPCTVRYMFNENMMAWNLNNDAQADAQDAEPTADIRDLYWGTRALGLGPDDAGELVAGVNTFLTGTHQQQESAPFRVFCQPASVEGGTRGAAATVDVHTDLEFKSLFDITSIFQDFPGDAQNGPLWINNAGDGTDQQTASASRNTEAGREVTVMSVGVMDNLHFNSNLSEDPELGAKTKHDAITLMCDFGSTCICRVAYFPVNQLNGQVGVRPLAKALGNFDDVQAANRRGLCVMSHRRIQNQPVVITPHFVALHNAVANATQLETGNDMLYIGNAYFSYPTNRRIFLIFNDRGRVPAAPVAPTVLSFETQNCEPVLHFDEFYRFANVLTRVRNVRVLQPNGTFAVPVAQTWIDAFSAVRLGDQGPGTPRHLNGSWCTMSIASFDFQDTYWNESPFEHIIADSRQTGVVHRSQLRVSQHLCAPLLNPNRRLGCSAPLQHDSLHLPPELRDFRIELRDIDFSFLPGNAEQATLEPLVMYEFNGGNQVPGTQPSLLYMPHFRSFSMTTTGQTFEIECFSPYGNPSYIAMYARSKVRPNEYIKQPLIKTLSVRSGTTMRKSNTILDAREHELFHLTQRNVHPRAEYTRATNQMRQVVLLCAEDIGDMGIREYQTTKRSYFVLSGTLDVPANVHALFIYNNRGLSIRNMEIGIVRV